jgi:signal-transduction protein with cAMP-binding, CBS, and nucleotidyltransferase domain
MKVKELHPRGAITISADESLRSAAKHLTDDGIGALVIVGSHGAKGIVSERDLTRAVADEVDLDAFPVGDYMTDSPVSVSVEDGVGDAIAKMNDYGVRHLVVLDHDEDIVGVLSVRDIVGLLASNGS